MLRCAVLDDYQRVALSMADWSALAGRVDVRPVTRHLPTHDAIADAIGDCEIVVAMRERTPFDAELFARLSRLRLLVTTGMKNAAIDLDAAAARGVVVCGTASRVEPPVELTWALILGLARHLVVEHASVRGGGWQETVGVDLHGRRLGLLGLGRIGSRVARVGAAFGMHVAAWSQNLTPARAAAEAVERAASKEELLERSDVVSIHLVLSERTRHLVDRDALRRMRRDAFLINTSRAALVDQEALLTALREGWIAGAGLDVFNSEPLPPDHPLRSAPNVLTTPHLGYVTRANYETYYREAIEDIAAFLNGSPIRLLGA